MTKKLDPEALRLLQERAAANLPPLPQWTPTFARSLSEPDCDEIPGRFLKRTFVTENGPMDFHIHLPEGDGPFPLILFYHGGGFVIGIEDYISTLQKLAAFLPAIIVAPRYRLAPEHKFPAGISDAHFAFERVVSGLELGKFYHPKIVVAGDSSGGNLSVNVVLNAKSKARIAGHILIYPWLDLSLSGDSCTEFSSGYGLTREKLIWYRNHYLPADIEQYDNPVISPLFAHLGKQPSTFIGVAECDVIRDDGKRYSQKLSAAGNPVTFKQYDGMIHGFFEAGDRLKQVAELFSDIQTSISTFSLID